MNKLRTILPFALAILLIVLCFSGVELSRVLLPDYKNTLERVEAPKNLSLLYLDNTSDPEPYPMALYDKDKAEKAEGEYQFKNTNELIGCLIYLYCGDESLSDNIDSFDFSEYLEYQDIKGLSRVYFIKDRKLVVADDVKDAKTYILNAAFTQSDVLCFSCVPEHEKKISSKKLERAYEKLNADYNKVMTKNDVMSFAEVEQLPADIDAESDTSDNLFLNFLKKYKKFDGYCQAVEMSGYYDAAVDLISSDSRPQISYSDMMYISFSDKNYRLVLIYDPYEMEIVGFSFYSE